MNARSARLPRLGVLGGMGPLATVDFLRKLIDATPGDTDQDHIPVIVYSVPQIPDRSMAFLAGSDAPWPYLVEGLRTLEDAGADAIAIPCNTAHVWHERLADAACVTVLHIGRVACEALAQGSGRIGRIGIMATSATLKARIYHRELERLGIEVIEPQAGAQDLLVMQGISAVKAGQLNRGRALLTTAADALQAMRVDALLLACTEIPIAIADARLQVPAVDATELLARACVTWWRRASDARAFAPSLNERS